MTTRLLVLGASLIAGMVVVSAGLLALLQVTLPVWYLLPATVLQMTGQSVPALDQAQLETIAAQATPQAGPSPVPAPQQGAAPGAQPTGTLPASTGSSASSAASSSSSPLLPSQRFTVLLLGSDNDLKFAANAVLTQSMILVSVDPSTKQVAMVSIPRDFWVPIPAYGYQKIDVAYEVGGIALARATVQSLFGVKVDYYAWVGLNGLVQVIDTVGGVNVTVQHPVLDETYPDDLNPGDPYAFFRLYIPAGPQHLDGPTALEYVRSRHGDLQSDFGRSARQQQVLLALKQKLQEPAMIARLPQVVQALQDAVKTDLPLPALLQLAALGRSIPPGSIQQQVLQAPDYASLGNSPDGTEQVVYPDWSAIRPEIARLLDLHDPAVSDTLAQQVWQENAPVQVLNGTSENDVAGSLTAYLQWQGFYMQQPGNADSSTYATSQVVEHGTAPGTAQALATLLHTTVTTAASLGTGPSVTVIVGRNHPNFPPVYGS